jgi:hypothetical protein
MEESDTSAVSSRDGPGTRQPKSMVRVPDERTRAAALERLFGPVAFASGLPTAFLRRVGS